MSESFESVLDSFSSLTLALVVSADRGPQLVFKYPPSLNNDSIIEQDSKENLEQKRAFFGPIFGLIPAVFEKTFCAKPPLCGQILDMYIEDRHFISFPTKLNSNESNNSIGNELSYFNFVFIIHKEDPHSFMYKDIVMKLTKAVEHEEIRRSFLSVETGKLQILREEISMVPHFTESYYVSQLLQVSSFALALSNLQQDLVKRGTSNVKINNWIDLQFSLDDFRVHPSVSIRPYQTILLLESRDIILASLPIECSASLKVLIQNAAPRKSFQELANELDIPLFHIYRMAAHLVYWKKARIIDTLAKANIYVIHPKFSLAHCFSDSMLYRDFNDAFPQATVKIADLLARFSSPCPLSDHLAQYPPASQLECLEVLCWLLKKDGLLQLFNFVYLISAPPIQPVQISAPPSPAFGPASSPTSNNGKLNMIQLSPLLRANSGTPTIPNFSSLGPSLVGSSMLVNLSNYSDAAKEPKLSAAKSWGSSLNLAGDISSGAISKVNSTDNLPNLKKVSSNDNLSISKVPSSENLKDPKLYSSLFAANKNRRSTNNSSNNITNLEAQALKKSEMTVSLGSIETSLHLFHLFKRLCPYFDGRHNLQEIMWCENVSRKELNSVLQVYSDVLARVMHE